MPSSFEILNRLDYDFFFLVVDKFLDISLPQLKNFYSIYDPFLTPKNSGHLLSLPTTQDFIKNVTAKSGHRAAIIPFKPSAKIEVICRQNNWLLVANPASINRLLEDKIKFYQICQNKNLPLVPSIIDTFNRLNFSRAQETLSQKLVAQTHFGWAGNSSYLINKYSDVKNKIPLNSIIKYSKFLSGYSLINNCCLTSGGLVQSPVGLQYTGIESLTKNKLATVGRQWPSLAPSDIQKQVNKITSDFSLILKKLDYRGFFGLDFLVHQGAVYLLECNPRLTASFAFYTQMEINNQINPLFALHLMEFTGCPVKGILLECDRFYDKNITGSEITKKNDFGVTTSKYNEFSIFSNTYDPVKISQDIISHVL
jgi:predicted ATP-grasp superfamily ATP-dependent carboligase